MPLTSEPPPTEPAGGRIDVECSGGVWALTLHGEHDISTQSTLREQLEHVHRAGGPVVVDVSQATFIDSTVIGALVRSRSEHDDPTTFVLVTPTHYQGTRLIELLGIGTTIPIYRTREAAIAAL